MDRLALRRHLPGQRVQLGHAAAAEADGLHRPRQVDALQHGVAHGEAGLRRQHVGQLAELAELRAQRGLRLQLAGQRLARAPSAPPPPRSRSSSWPCSSWRARGLAGLQLQLAGDACRRRCPCAAASGRRRAPAAPSCRRSGPPATWKRPRPAGRRRPGRPSHRTVTRCPFASTQVMSSSTMRARQQRWRGAGARGRRPAGPPCPSSACAAPRPRCRPAATRPCAPSGWRSPAGRCSSAAQTGRASTRSTVSGGLVCTLHARRPPPPAAATGRPRAGPACSGTPSAGAASRSTRARKSSVRSQCCRATATPPATARPAARAPRHFKLAHARIVASPAANRAGLPRSR